MRFLLMINVPHGRGSYEHTDWTPEDWQAHMDYWRRLNRGLTAAGELEEVLALTPPERARVVRAGANGKPIVTDGPFPETKEFLAGFWVLRVASEARAHAIAAEASLVPGPGGAPLHMAFELREIPSAPPA